MSRCAIHLVPFPLSTRYFRPASFLLVRRSEKAAASDLQPRSLGRRSPNSLRPEMRFSKPHVATKNARGKNSRRFPIFGATFLAALRGARKGLGVKLLAAGERALEVAISSRGTLVKKICSQVWETIRPSLAKCLPFSWPGNGAEQKGKAGGKRLRRRML